MIFFSDYIFENKTKQFERKTQKRKKESRHKKGEKNTHDVIPNANNRRIERTQQLITNSNGRKNKKKATTKNYN